VALGASRPNAALDHDAEENHRKRNIALPRTVSSAGGTLNPKGWSHSIGIGELREKPAGRTRGGEDGTMREHARSDAVGLARTVP